MKRYLHKLFNKLIRRRQFTAKQNNPDDNYDIIGDVHGYCTELELLLHIMGYSQIDGLWQHPERKVIFAGDFISRGPDTKGVISLVRNMVENKTGFAVLGNHELNAIGYFTYNKKGKPLFQPPSSNKLQMEKIKEQYKNSESELGDTIKWLRTLPFFIETGSFRVVHAYWSDKHVQIIDKNVTKGKLTKKLIKEIVRNETPFAKAVRQTTRGIELNLPKDLIIKDSKNVRRTNFRVKWWESSTQKTFRELSFGNRFKLPEYTVPEQLLVPFDVYDESAPPVFFGHYCIKDMSLMVSPNACCVDNCLAGGGQLAAYRWNGEATIKESNFVYQPRLG
ncbi:metallophosphoesterase [Natronoflexus pectinivorans]|uniref:Calcineurin-like phosphoesterase family protein n=1 Tax=Natronoflexus pectinivorans TaxID=682526 RepID=A0A4R2GKI0_9BACT|nr:metallophosphoesterase [Natronoflexus pectinivorans]TCO09179.1 calcineurin-like phosphoesterase family protein [Natronoflexus pectinivorans]